MCFRAGGMVIYCDFKNRDISRENRMNGSTCIARCLYGDMSSRIDICAIKDNFTFAIIAGTSYCSVFHDNHLPLLMKILMISLMLMLRLLLGYDNGGLRNLIVVLVILPNRYIRFVYLGGYHTCLATVQIRLLHPEIDISDKVGSTSWQYML